MILNVFDLEELFDLFPDFGPGDLNGAEFTVWDHNGDSAIFQFTTDGVTAPNKIPIRFDGSRANDTDPPLFENEMFNQTQNPPTWPGFLADEISHALRVSGLDIEVYKASYPEERFSFGFDTIFETSFAQTIETYQTSETDTTDIAFGRPVALFIEGAAVSVHRK